MLNERWGKWFFWLFVAGFNITFLVQHALGAMGMTRRVYTYPNLAGWGILNLISTTGAFIMAIAVGLLIYIIIKAMGNGVKAPGDPWDANTLEWTTSSTPGLKNFEQVMQVRSTRPYRDYKRPDDADWKKNR